MRIDLDHIERQARAHLDRIDRAVDPLDTIAMVKELRAADRVIATARMMCDGSGLANDLDMVRSLNMYDAAVAGEGTIT